jgi:NadR type nicotinamide-nucleotide adenylyltransferase
MKKIVVIGPESTGKSSLCQLLAAHYQSGWVKEYAREYLLTNGTEYTYDNLLTVAKGQIENEEIFIANNSFGDKPIFIDTDMYVMKVWCEYVFEKCHHWILNQIVERKYDLYLLCNTDLPWVKDELREYPDQETREKLFKFYKDLLVNQDTPWVMISGDYDARLQQAIAAVDRL